MDKIIEYRLISLGNQNIRQTTTNIICLQISKNYQKVSVELEWNWWNWPKYWVSPGKRGVRMINVVILKQLTYIEVCY